MGRGHGVTSLVYRGPGGDKKAIASFEMADTNYLGVFGLKLAAGRNLYPSDTIRELLINETAAQQMGFVHPQDAIGHIAITGIDDLGGPIVGVIKDFHSESLRGAITPYFVSSDRESQTTVSIRLALAVRNPEALHTLLGKIDRIWHEIYPNQSFKYAFLDNSIAALYSRERHLSGLLSLAMFIAIVISCMGLLALATFAAQQRSKEMSIRRVLGASIGRIFILLTGNFLWPVVLAFVIATPIAWYFMHRWLQDFVYRTTASWWIFASCGLVAVAIALLTVGYQAYRTATANPAENLKTE
jgi:ABC-type antimicrobial peptide transport system permease subunit